MKKIIVLSLVLLMTIATVTSVYAVSSFKMELKPSNKEVSKNEEIVVEAVISDIEFDKGIVALGGMLEYDTNSLELVKFEAGDNWSKPSYNEKSQKFATDRDGYGKDDETVFKVTFKVKEEAKENLVIELSEASASNGEDEVKLEGIKTSVTVKSGTSKPDDSKPDDQKPDINTSTDDNNTNTNTNTNNNNNNTQNTNSNKDDKNTNTNTNNSKNTNTNTNKNTNKSNNSSNNTNVANNADNLKGGILPKAGTTSIIFGILGIMIIVAGIFYARIKIMDNNAKH